MDMLLPLYRQYDSGFGAVANSFKASAEALDKNASAITAGIMKLMR